jgi:hypothetical protein
MTTRLRVGSPRVSEAASGPALDGPRRLAAEEVVPHVGQSLLPPGTDVGHVWAAQATMAHHPPMGSVPDTQHDAPPLLARRRWKASVSSKNKVLAGPVTVRICAPKRSAISWSGIVKVKASLRRVVLPAVSHRSAPRSWGLKEP